jgi:hypothetical protein
MVGREEMGTLNLKINYLARSTNNRLLAEEEKKIFEHSFFYKFGI